ncbi:MAG: hypothetical protein U0547_11235 [Dehalococcoidia bacterium]
MPTLGDARDAGQELLQSLTRGDFEEYLAAEEAYFALCTDVLGRTLTKADGDGLRALMDVQSAIEEQLAVLSRGVAAEMVRLRRRGQASRAYVPAPIREAAELAQG